MKKLLLLVSIAAVFNACKKEEAKKDDPAPAGPKGNIVFKIGNDSYDLLGKNRVASPGIWEVYSDSTAQNFLMSFRLTVNSNVPRDYPLVEVVDNANVASFNLVIINGSQRTEYASVSGTFKLTDTADDKWTGTFSGKVKNKETNEELDLTGGRIIAVAP